MKAIIKTSGDSYHGNGIVKCEINSQKEFEDAIRKNWTDDDIYNAIMMSGFSQLYKKCEELENQNPMMDPPEFIEWLWNNRPENGIFPNIYRKFKNTGYINLQTEEQACQVFSEERWNQLTKEAQDTDVTTIWGGDYYEYPDEEDWLNTYYNRKR